jgi:hypothetical protein
MPSAILINQDITPPHAYNQTSVLQLIYKCLSPNDIVRLMAGDELIVVIPVLDHTKSLDHALRVHHSYTRAFENFIYNTLRRLHPGNRTCVVADLIRNCYTLLHEDSPFIKFACRLKNYPEQEHFEREVVDTRAIDMYWQQGAGINLAVCRYSMQRLVMMEFQHVGCLEVYGKVRPDSFLSDRNNFSNNVQDVLKLVGPLVDQLSLFDGCRFSSVEILRKYYRAVSTANQREKSYKQMKFTTSLEKVIPMQMMEANETTNDPENLLSLIRLELIDENIERFVGLVEHAYRTSIERE